MPSSDLHIPSSIQIDWLIRYLLKEGIAPELIDQQLGEDSTAQSNFFLNAKDYIEFLGWAAEILKKPHLGLELGPALQPGDVGLYAYLATTSKTLREMIQTLMDYKAIFMYGQAMTLDFLEFEDRLVLSGGVQGEQGEGIRIDAEFTICLMVQMFRTYSDRNWSPLKVTFVHSPIPPLEKYQALFNCEVEFNSKLNTVHFEPEALDTPLNRSDPDLRELLRTQADTILEKVLSEFKLTDKVRMIIYDLLEKSRLTLDEVAEKLHMTPRTLNRKLKQEGTSYNSLRDEVIVTLARDALSIGHESISEISDRLGYSDPSAFIRAFKRLTGITPKHYRAELGH